MIMRNTVSNDRKGTFPYQGKVWRHKYWWFAAACGFLLCFSAGENLFNWACITNGTNPDFRKDFGEVLRWIGLTVSPVFFSVCVAVAFRHWLLAEKWLLLILGCAWFEIPLTWGLRNPYIDEPFYDQPFLLYLWGFSGWFIISAVLLGPVIVWLHFAFRNKRRPPVSLWRRIVSPLCALLLSAILAAACWKLLNIVC